MENYDITKYERPSVAADSVVFAIKNTKGKTYRNDSTKSLMVILIKRKVEPFKSKFALPGGFLRPNESLETATYRELKEETGITDAKLFSLNTYSKPGRDPRGWIISCASLALIAKCPIESDSESDAEEAVWFNFKYTQDTAGKDKIELKSDNETIVIECSSDSAKSSSLAFDHAQIIYDAYKRLQELILHSDIIFNLLPTRFKISEMQAIYEIILNKKETSANFRRKVLPLIEETGQTSSEEGHRPSQLYRKRL